MKKVFVITLFTLAMLAWAAAQQPGSDPRSSSGQATSPSSQTPDASQPSMPGPGGAQAAPQSPMATAPVTEGCLGGSNPNYTITDKSGTTYKLNIPPTADTTKLAAHVGESVSVAGTVNGKSSIDVQGIGRGTGKCPATGSTTGAQPPPKQ